MKHSLLAGVTALAIFVSAGSAGAVDVVNEDDMNYEVNVISIDEDAITVYIQPGDQVEGICDKCSIRLGSEDLLEVEGDEVVYIRGGKFERQAD